MVSEAFVDEFAIQSVLRKRSRNVQVEFTIPVFVKVHL